MAAGNFLAIRGSSPQRTATRPTARVAKAQYADQEDGGPDEGHDKVARSLQSLHIRHGSKVTIGRYVITTIMTSATSTPIMDPNLVPKYAVSQAKLTVRPCRKFVTAAAVSAR
ncbi:MAG: hypothetical protein ACLTMG_03535 [Oscillospiraceae bacterium]